MQRCLIFLIAITGCSLYEAPPEAPDSVARCPIGDPTQPAQLEITHLGANGDPVMTTDGAMVPLFSPVQGGGRVVYLGARATNLDGCHAEITVSFGDLP